MRKFIFRTFLVILIISGTIWLWPSKSSYTKSGVAESLDAENIKVMNEAEGVTKGSLVRMYIPQEVLDELPADDPFRKVGILALVLEVQDTGIVVSDPDGDTYWCDETLNVERCQFMETRNLNSPAYTSVVDTIVRSWIDKATNGG